MVLHFRHRVNESRRAVTPSRAIEGTVRWLSRASRRGRWDIALELKSRAALRRASEKLEATPETYCALKIRPRAASAKELAVSLYRQARGGPLEIHAGTEEEPCHIYAQLPDPKSPSLDALAIDPQLVHLHTPSVLLTFSERDMHRRYHIPAIWKVKERIRKAFEVAASTIGSNLSFDEWSLEMADMARRRRESLIWSSEIGEFPYNVGVSASGLEKSQREEIFGHWLEMLGEIRLIEASLKAPLSEFEALLGSISAFAEKVTGNTWGLSTLSTEGGASQETILEVLRDDRIVRQLKKWAVRIHGIKWRLSDPSLDTEESENAIVLVQEPREFHRTIHIGFPLEDMDSPRFRGAIAELQHHIPADLGNLADWELVGDPRATPRGTQLAQYLERIRVIAKEFFEKHRLGPSSAPLMDIRGRTTRRVTDRQEGEVAFKQAVIRAMEDFESKFEFDESTSWAERGILDFVRMNPSGTRNLITVSRDKYGGAFGVDAAASAVPCVEAHLDMASQNPLEIANPGWGLRGLMDLMNHRPADMAWTWKYKDQMSLESGLKEATERARLLLLLFSELESVLTEMRLLARR